MAKRERVDLLLVKKGLVGSRQKAQALIMAGQVFTAGQRVDKPGSRLPEGSELEVKEQLPFVSRGGLKLKAALEYFLVDPAGRKCLDVGASTGGFTDCLLQGDAKSVHAVDVGYGQLDWKLRSDPRVTVLERTNFRNIDEDRLPPDFHLAAADVSFISLKLILPSMKRFLVSGADVIVLVKPQFEAGREQVGKGGIIRDEGVRAQVLADVLAAAEIDGFSVVGHMESPITGADGNVEFLAHLKWEVEQAKSDQQSFSNQGSAFSRR
jgi:23S rRNA (cytidine1920-2'-O)/16S rRNA (cytidine1409-2'-O)-methyltransferase